MLHDECHYAHPHDRPVQQAEEDAAVSAPVVVGFDPGFAAFGWAAVALYADREEVLGAGVIVTKPEAKKRGIYVADDNFRRVQEIAAGVRGVIEQYRPCAWCAELPSGAKGFKAAQGLAYGVGVLATLASSYAAPVVVVQPQELKDRLCGSRDASKDDVFHALCDRYGESALRVLSCVLKTRREHPTDALGAIVASLDSEVIRMARRLAA